MGIRKSGTMRVDIEGISDTMQPVVNEWFNATISIEDPHIEQGTFNRVTNKVTGRTPGVLWTGPARIQAMRWPNVATSRQEAISARTMVFHIPLSATLDPTLVREGLRIRVTDGGLSPHLTSGLYVITSSVNSSFAWDRRIETMMDQGATT